MQGCGQQEEASLGHLRDAYAATPLIFILIGKETTEDIGLKGFMWDSNTTRNVVVVQLLSRAWLCVTPWTAARQASLSIIISWNLLKLISIDSMLLYNQLILICRPLLLLPSIFPSIRVFSCESALHIRWPKEEQKGIRGALKSEARER